MINQSGRSVSDSPLVGETSFSKSYLIIGMILCSLVHFIFLGLANNALLDLVIYLFLCLLMVPIVFVLFVAPNEKTHTYYITGELTAQIDQIYQIGIMAIISFALSFLISLALVEELINIYNGDVKAIPLPISLNETPYMAMVYLIFVVAMPIAEECFWRVFLPKSLPHQFESNILIATFYGIMNYIILVSIFHKWEYGIIGLIYSVLVHFVFSYIHKHTRFFGLAIVSFAMRLGFVFSLHFFLISKLSKENKSPEAANPPPSIMHHHHHN